MRAPEAHPLPLSLCYLPACRPSRSVVLSVRGSNSMEDLLTDMMDRPVDITTWLPQELRQASGCSAGWLEGLWGLLAQGQQALAACWPA